MTDKRDRKAALAHVAERVLELNDTRSEDFQDQVARLVDDARELWRGDDGELPAPATDPAFDALIAFADESEGSPTEMRDAAHRALRAAGKRVPAAR